MSNQPQQPLRLIRNTRGSVLMEGTLAFPLLLFMFAAMQWGGDIQLARIKLAIAERQAYGMAASRLSLRTLTSVNKNKTIWEGLNNQYFAGKTNEGAGLDNSQNLIQNYTVLHSTRQDYAWYGMGVSRLELDYRIPLWLQGMLAIPDIFWNRDGATGPAFKVALKDTWKIYAHDVPKNGEAPAAVSYGRSEYGSLKRHPRNWPVADICGRTSALNFILKGILPGSHFENWDKYVQLEVFADSNSWKTSSSIGSSNVGSSYGIKDVKPENIKAYKRYNSFENWSE